MSMMISEWTLTYLQLLVYFLQCICVLFCIGNKSYHLITIRKGKQWWYLPFKNKDIFLPFKKLPLHLRKTAKLWTGQQEFYPVLVTLWLYWSFFLSEHYSFFHQLLKITNWHSSRERPKTQEQWQQDKNVHGISKQIPRKKTPDDRGKKNKTTFYFIF